MIEARYFIGFLTKLKNQIYSENDDYNIKRLYSGYGLLVIALLVWAGNAIVGRSTAEASIPPIAFTFWRWAIACGIFLLVFGIRTWKQRDHFLKAWKFIILFSLISISGFNAVFYIALQKSTALQVCLIQSILPVLVLLLGLIILRERINKRQCWGVVFSVSGAAIIVLRGDLDVLSTLSLSEGDLWALLAVFLWACQAFLMRWKPQNIEIMPFMTVISFLGVIALIPFYL